MWKKGEITEKGKKKEPLVVEKLRNWDFQTEIEEKKGTTIYRDIYDDYKSYFTEFRSEFENVKAVSSQLEGVVEDMVQASNNVKTSAEYIAEGAQSQSVDVGRCMDVADNLAEKINSMDDKSKELIKIAVDMSNENLSGREAVQNLGVHQQKNHEVIKAITEDIYVLLEKTQKINDVTQVLYSIASQTNLLALNASIEAARAGEAGKGFAVVADEVRKLSEESRAASEHINESLSEITKELDHLKTVMDTSGETFNAQTEAVEQVILSVEQVNRSVDGFIVRQREFNDDVIELSGQKEKLIDSIGNIASVVEESSAITEEVASLTITQNSMSDILVKMSRDLCSKVGIIDNNSKKISTNIVVKKRKKIAMIWDLDDPFWEPATKEAHKTAKVLGFDITVFAPKTRGDQGTQEMVNHLDQILTNSYDAIVISPIVDSKVADRLRNAVKQGIKIVFIQSAVEDIPYEAIVGTNTIQCGINAGKVTKQLLDNKGEVIVGMWTDNKMVCIEERAEGFIKELQQDSQIKVNKVGVVGEPSEEEAEKIIGKMLKDYPNTNLVYATNVGWGLAYAKYIEKHHSNIKVVTVDFTKDVANQMRKGNVSAAIAQRPFAWGSTPLELLVDVFEGKTVKKYMDTGTYEVNANNMQIFEQRF